MTTLSAPHTYTSLPTFELHTHSGPALTSSILRALSALPNLRPAEPGEFTLWAFRNGKMDLTQVEAMKDLIDAETEVQRKVARWGVEVSGFSFSIHSSSFLWVGN